MSYDYGKEIRRDGGQKLIAEALKDYEVRDVNQGYCFRVNGTLDLYPTSGKFHNLRTNVRGYYPNKHAGNLIQFVIEQISAGKKQSLTVRQSAHSKSGECLFCGKEAKLRMCDECKIKPSYILLRKAA